MIGGRAKTRNTIVVVTCLASLVLVPSPALAQDQAGIVGSVRDETGSFLSGVIVEARSPVLIEQVRSTSTDAAGHYQFVGLPAGTYTVTLRLSAFRTLVREDIVLTGAFVANVDGTMVVGPLEEMITVTGESPLVDVVSNRDQTVLSADAINALPAASSILTAMQYVPGVTGNMFGTMTGMGLPSIYGSDGPDSQTYVDGISSGMQISRRNVWVGGIGVVTDEAQVAEIVFDTASLPAEFPQSGVRTNLVPKAGGNTFAGDVFVDGGHQTFADNNLTPELEAQDFVFAPTAWNWSINPSFGGPIKEDSVWFFASYVDHNSKDFLTDIFFDPDEPSTPDGLGDDLRAFTRADSSAGNVRVTWQLNDTNKLSSAFTMHQRKWDRLPNAGSTAAEAMTRLNSHPTYMSTTRWTAPLRNRLLVEATFSYQRADLNADDFEENGVGRLPLLDVASGLFTGTSLVQNSVTQDHRRLGNVSASYVTRSHNFKGGFQYENNLRYFSWQNNGDILEALVFNGFPIGVLVADYSGGAEDLRKQNCECGFYAQDAWTMDRLTVNIGVRYDWFNNTLAGGVRPAGFFLPEIRTEAIENFPDWHDWTGRFGVAYDLFGDSRTALKASAGKYVGNDALDVTVDFSPYSRGFDFRPWTDLNGDGTVINPGGTPQFAEIGPSSNPNFGRPETNQRLDSGTQRLSNWEFSAGVEHQLNDSWSISGKWYRRRFGDFRWVGQHGPHRGRVLAGDVHRANRSTPAGRRRRSDHRLRAH